MATETADKLIINNTSQEFLQDVIRTFPVETIKDSEITMLAKGILPSHLNDKKDEERFLAECRKKGVIPNWKVMLKYNGEKNNFVFHSDSLRGTSPSDIIRGGKPYEVKVKTKDSFLDGTGFDTFRRGLFPKLLQEDYHIHTGDIWTTTYRLTGYSQGTAKATGVLFGGETYFLLRGLELKLEDSLAALKPKDKRVLVSWFDSLRERYD